MTLLLAGCATSIHPPVNPPMPRPVFVLDHGRHSSLVITTADGKLVRYSYGDWRWYAHNDQGIRQGFSALFLKTPGTLGWRELPGPATLDAVLSGVRVGIERVHQLSVAGALIDSLQRQLDDVVDAEKGSTVDNRRYDLRFVRHPQDYSVSYHSNDAVADWLRQLGCTVSRARLTADWQVHRQAQPPPENEPGSAR